MKKRVFLILYILSLFQVVKTVANDSTFNELKLKTETINTPENQAKYLLTLCDSLKNNDVSQWESCIHLADSITKKNNLKQYFADICYQNGDFNLNKGEYNIALIQLLDAEKLYTEANNLQGLARVYNKIGLINISQADFPGALKYFIQSLNIKDSINDTEGISNTYSNIGNVLFEMYDNAQALEYFKKSVEIDKQNNNETGMAKTLMNIGLVYKENFDYEKAIEYYQQSLDIHKKNDNQQDIALCYSNLALIYMENGQNDLALNYFDQSLTIYEKLDIKKGIASVYSNIGFFYSMEGDYSTAIDFLKKAIRIAQEINSVQDIEITSQALSEAYKNVSNYQEAYNYQVLYKAMYDKLNNDAQARMFTQLELNYEFEQQKKQIEFEQQQKELQHQAQIKRQRMITTFILFGAVALLALALVIYRSYKQKKRDNQLLQEQKTAIEEQRDKINKQNKDITASIHYAKRIQTALLPPDIILNQILVEYFVLYKPRDIVSGDYYWVSEKNNKKIIVAADCTGHGVPGAFMSMLGMSFLNEIIQQIDEISCSTILNHLREYVISSLRQTGAIGENKDGMDLAMVIIDYENKILQYAGAYNPLLLIRNGEVVQYKADKMPIGISDKAEESFSNEEIEIQSGDCIYMFSDGYVDQFGGPKFAKFKSKPFRELLLSIHTENMTQQKEILNTTIENWRGDQEQIDDILVIGIKL